MTVTFNSSFDTARLKFQFSDNAIASCFSKLSNFGEKKSSRRCQVTVLGKLFTFTVHHAAKLVAPLRVARVTAGLAESNGSLLPGL